MYTLSLSLSHSRYVSISMRIKTYKLLNWIKKNVNVNMFEYDVDFWPTIFVADILFWFLSQIRE